MHSTLDRNQYLSKGNVAGSSFATFELKRFLSDYRRSVLYYVPTIALMVRPR